MPRPFSEWLKLQLLAARIRSEIDRELGEALSLAIQHERPEDWAKVHDRLNIVGEFEHADTIRELFSKEHDQ